MINQHVGAMISRPIGIMWGILKSGAFHSISFGGDLRPILIKKERMVEKLDVLFRVFQLILILPV